MQNKTPVSRESTQKNVFMYERQGTSTGICMYVYATIIWNRANNTKNNASEWHRELEQERFIWRRSYGNAKLLNFGVSFEFQTIRIMLTNSMVFYAKQIGKITCTQQRIRYLSGITYT